MVTEPSRSSVTEPGRSSVTEPGRSMVTEPGRSMVTEPGRSMVTEPGRSMVTEPGRSINFKLLSFRQKHFSHHATCTSAPTSFYSFQIAIKNLTMHGKLCNL